MRRATISFFALLALAAVTAAQDDEALVHELFERYKTALLAGEGDVAADLVDADTLSYFEEIKELSLAGSEDQIAARPFVDRLLIVAMRHEIPADELAPMQLEDLLRHAVEAGWIGKQAILQLGIGEIEVEGDEASAEAVVTGVQLPEESEEERLRYRFVREDGRWKFRFHSLVEGINRIVSQITAQMGTKEDDLIFVLVEQLSGRKVLPEVWSRPPAEAPTPTEPGAPASPDAP